MRKLRSGSVSISAIFEYPNPIDAKLFKENLEAKEWFRGRRSRRPGDRHNSGMKIGDANVDEDSLLQIGVTERCEIFYSNEISLPDFGNSAVLVARSKYSIDITDVLNEAKKIFQILSDIEMEEQLSVFEVYTDYDVRVNDKQDIDEFLNQDALKRIQDIHGELPSGQILTLKSHAEYNSENWYRISIDLTKNMNPLLWGVDYQRRFKNLESIQDQNIESDINETLKETLETSETGDEIEW